MNVVYLNNNIYFSNRSENYSEINRHIYGFKSTLSLVERQEE